MEIEPGNPIEGLPESANLNLVDLLFMEMYESLWRRIKGIHV